MIEFQPGSFSRAGLLFFIGFVNFPPASFDRSATVERCGPDVERFATTMEATRPEESYRQLAPLELAVGFRVGFPYTCRFPSGERRFASKKPVRKSAHKVADSNRPTTRYSDWTGQPAPDLRKLPCKAALLPQALETRHHHLS